jgi:hypothetical protein
MMHRFACGRSVAANSAMLSWLVCLVFCVLRSVDKKEVSYASSTLGARTDYVGADWWNRSPSEFNTGGFCHATAVIAPWRSVFNAGIILAYALYRDIETTRRVRSTHFIVY